MSQHVKFWHHRLNSFPKFESPFVRINEALPFHDCIKVTIFRKGQNSKLFWWRLEKDFLKFRNKIQWQVSQYCAEYYGSNLRQWLFIHWLYNVWTVFVGWLVYVWHLCLFTWPFAIWWIQLCKFVIFRNVVEPMNCVWDREVVIESDQSTAGP